MAEVGVDGDAKECTEQAHVREVPTGCDDWSLNVETTANRLFWWNKTYSISIWEDVVNIAKARQEICDSDVWTRYIAEQLSNVFKVCPICTGPECSVDMGICCYCSSAVHIECSSNASASQIAWKPANAHFRAHMRVCFDCDDVHYDQAGLLSLTQSSDHPMRACSRVLSIRAELPETISAEVDRIAALQVTRQRSPAVLAKSLRSAITPFFQSTSSMRMLRKKAIHSKGGCVGVIAKADIPAFTIVGVYPGYKDYFSGEQMKIGRPVPRYALANYNCADYNNVIFDELLDTFTPYINEPSEKESSNCSWIQEHCCVEGRLSVITVRPIRRGEELLIGYGPLYSRNYPYNYDAFSCMQVDSDTDELCYSLWRWTDVESENANFVLCIAYDTKTKSYRLSQTNDPNQHATMHSQYT